MVDKQDSTWNYKTTTLLYNIFQGRQIWKQTYYLEKVDMKEDNQNTRCSKKSYGYDEQQIKMERLLYYSDKNIYK